MLTRRRRERVTILAGRLDPTAGSHIYNRELAARLSARGYQVTVVTIGAPVEIGADVRVIEIQPQPSAMPPLLWRFASVSQLRRCRAALRDVELPDCDVVVAAEHLLLQGHRDRFPSVPVIYLPHSLLVREEIESYRMDPVQQWCSVKVYTHLQKWALRESEATLRFTRQACEALEARYGDRIRTAFHVNPMGIEISPAAPREAKATTKFLWVGQLIPRKRIDVALRALAQVADRNWEFDIVGDGVSRAGLEQLTTELSLGDRVTFHGHQSNPQRFYREADVFVFPSWFENSPLSMLEAMSAGVTCLAMKHDGARFINANGEIINDGVDGFLAADDEDYGRLVKRLLDDPASVRQAGVEARRTIERKHTWERHLDRYETIFDDLIAAARS